MKKYEFVRKSRSLKLHLDVVAADIDAARDMLAAFCEEANQTPAEAAGWELVGVATSPVRGRRECFYESDICFNPEAFASVEAVEADPVVRAFHSAAVAVSVRRQVRPSSIGWTDEEE